jgi:hypothetical protein
VLLFIFIFTYTLFGLEVFAYRAKIDFKNDVVDNVNGESPQNNFDTFLDSFTTVFVVLTNESMSEIYFNHYRTVGATASTIFFISLVIIGQKILLNLFLAILLENFDEGALKQHMHDYSEKQVRINEESLWNVTKKNLLYYGKIVYKKINKFCRRGKDYSDDDMPDDHRTGRMKLIKGLQMLAAPSKGQLKESVNQIL